MATFLGGRNDDADGTLSASILRLRGRAPAKDPGAPDWPSQAPTPGTHHPLEGFTPARAAPADGSRALADPAEGGRSLDGELGRRAAGSARAERREDHEAERRDATRREARAAAEAGGGLPGQQSAVARAVADVQEAAIRDASVKEWASIRGQFPDTFRAIHGDHAPRCRFGTPPPCW